MDFPKNLPGEDFINSWYPILIAVVCGVIYAIRSYFRGGQCMSQEKLKGKTAIVTGANSGIGREIVREFVKRGARVIMACRDETKGNEALKQMEEITRSKNITFMKLDLNSHDSIREFVKEFNEKEKELHILVNNAGVMCHPNEKTVDGNEIHLQTNYLGPFLLTELLLDKLKASAPSRVINTSANAYNLAELYLDNLNLENMDYKPGNAYSQSKLAVMLWTRQLSKHLEGSGITVNVTNPGIVNSDIHRYMPFKQSTFVSVGFAPFIWFFMKTCKDGAQTAINCAVAKEEESVSGKYYMDCLMVDPGEVALDDDRAKKLWDVTLKMLGLNESKAVSDKDMRSAENDLGAKDDPQGQGDNTVKDASEKKES